MRKVTLKLSRAGVAGLISTALVLPFVVLELINRRSFQEGFPLVLFVFMWLLTLAFALVLLPIVRRPQTDNKTSLVRLLPRVAFLILVASLWVSLVVDQMPCFLGVPNCD
jgi:hypothetical protein